MAKPSEHFDLDAKVTIPQHVVYRTFVTETVLLNLQTGKYHGMNPTAGHMLEALHEGDSVRAALAAVAERYAKPPAEVERDMVELCRGLLDRGLVELDAPPT